MERRCDEPHCLQLVPEYLFQSHQDQHLAERLVAEEFEQQRHEQDNDDALARALALGPTEVGHIYVDNEDEDYLMALALNREFRTEEEERSFRNVQVAQCSIKRLTILEERNRS